MWRGCFNAARMADGGWPGGLANHKFRLNGDFGDVFASSFDQIDDGLCRDLPLLSECLLAGVEPGVGFGAPGTAAEAAIGTFFRTPKAGFRAPQIRPDGPISFLAKK